MQSFSGKLLTMIISKYPLLSDLFSSKLEVQVSVPPAPFAVLNKKISECIVAVVTTAGVHLKGDTPFDLTLKDGDTSFRIIPKEAETFDLMISHNHYDHRDADSDINIVFPVGILKGFVKKGIIKDIAPRNIGFMGSIYDTEKLTNISAREASSILKEDNVDIALLCPA